MKSRTKILAIVLILIMAITTGCGGGQGSSATAENLLAYYAYETEPYTNLDPSVEYSNGIVTLQNVYEMLTKYNYETETVDPMLAESWESSEDGLTWVFQIRQGVKFHDGFDLNAEAVKASIERTLEMGLGAAFIWDCVESIEVTGEYEVTFNLGYAAPIDLIASAAYAAYIMSPAPESISTDSTWYNDGNDSGTGPYKISKVTPGEEVILEKFDEYWGGWTDGQYTNAIIKKIAEGSARRQLLEKGEATISGRFSTTDSKALKQVSTLTVQTDITWKNVIGFFNTQKAPFDNADFRRALSYAFPYEQTVNDVRENNAAQSFGLVPPGLWGHDETLPQYSFDMEKAKEYIKKSGIDTNGMKIEMTFTSGSDDYRNLSQLFQINLKQLGIDMQLREMSWDNVWEKAKNPNPKDRQDLTMMIWWPDYASPLSWFTSLVLSEPAEDILFNLAYVNNPILDKMLDEAEKSIATDRDKSEQLFVDIQKIAIDEAYYIHMYDDQMEWVVQSKVKGFKSSPAYQDVVYFYELSE